MKTSMKLHTTLLPTLFIFLCLYYVGCSDKSESENGKVDTGKQVGTEMVAQDTVRLEITGNDQMQYDRKKLHAPAGALVILTLKHVGTMAKTVMGHNWILLKQGIDLAQFATDALQAKASDYIPPSRAGDIIAHTKLLGGGESDSVTFMAPSIGSYQFLCSFSGHYGTMNGKFIVEGKSHS